MEMNRGDEKKEAGDYGDEQRDRDSKNQENEAEQ